MYEITVFILENYNVKSDNWDDDVINDVIYIGTTNVGLSIVITRARIL